MTRLNYVPRFAEEKDTLWSRIIAFDSRKVPRYRGRVASALSFVCGIFFSHWRMKIQLTSGRRTQHFRETNLPPKACNKETKSQKSIFISEEMHPQRNTQSH